jgi:hypothetical protein
VCYDCLGMAPIIFVSCGQFTVEERHLGKQVCEIVRGFNFEPYFAETQSNLKGLHENILTKLNECNGLVTIMHPRGEVEHSASIKHVRGSVWIEQEIAIAAFIAHCLGRKIEVAAFIHESVKREGIRDLLHLNPISFRSDNEVLEQLPLILATWKPESSSAKLKITYKKVKITGERHDYILEVFVENTGSIRIEEYALDLSFPSAFLNQTLPHQLEITERRTKTHRYFRATEQHYPNKAIFPEDTARVFTLAYFVDHDLYFDNTAMGQSFVATLRCGRDQPIVQEHAIRDFQIF